MAIRKAKTVLPCDLIYEILIRTDTQIFTTIRRVCKEWRGLLAQPSFLKNHHLMNKRFRGFFFKHSYNEQKHCFLPDPYLPPSYMGPLPSILNFLPTNKPTILTSNPNGFLLCLDSKKSVISTCANLPPVSGSRYPKPYPLQRLSINQKWFLTVAPAAPFRFKIARILQFGGGVNGIEVFDSNARGQWKDITPAQEFLSDYGYSSAILVNGHLCWLKKSVMVIVCFDLWTEKLVENVRIPAAVTKVTMLSSIDGRLGLICNGIGRNVMDFWRFSSGEGDVLERWEMQGSLQLQEHETSFWTVWNNSTVVNGVVVLWVKNDDDHMYYFRWYNYKQKNSISTNFCWLSGKMFFFQSDYIPLILHAQK